MDKKLKVKPHRAVISPDQSSITLRVPPDASGNMSARIFVKHLPEGMEIEKVKRNKWEVSWKPPLREKAKIVLGAEDVAGSQRMTCELVPNEEELAKYDAAGGELDGKEADKPEEGSDGDETEA